MNAIDLTLFKMVGFYQMVDGNGPKVFGMNAYQLCNGALTAMSAAVTAVGLSGVFYRVNGSNEYDVKVYMKMVSSVVFVMIGYLKTCAVIGNAGSVRGLFDVAHESFSTSAHCKRFGHKMDACGRRFTAFFLRYLSLFAVVAFSYTTMPAFLNDAERAAAGKTRGGGHDRRGAAVKINVLNYMYPITTETYNAHYTTIYVVESMVCAYAVLVLCTVDLFLFALLKVISTRYEIVLAAYGAVGRAEGNDSKKFLEEILSITYECQNIYKQSKIFYKISRPIVLILMVADTISMIAMPYLIVTRYVQNGLSIIFEAEAINYILTLCVAIVHAYLYCSLFQLVNDKEELVNFEIYSCDWMCSDIQIKQKILLMMRMNDRIDLKMKVTPTKYIGLPMFSTILSTSYRITSVLINSNIQKS